MHLPRSIWLSMQNAHQLSAVERVFICQRTSDRSLPRSQKRQDDYPRGVKYLWSWTR
jgi:hypothetical protein